MLKQKIKKILAVFLAPSVFAGVSPLVTFNTFNSPFLFSLKSIAETYGDFSFTILEGDVVEITSYTGSSSVVNIPSEIDGKKVTSIGDSAFYNSQSITKVNIPDSVTNIEEYAFFACSNLTSINIPSSITTIRDSVFNSCSSLTSITIPNSVTSIESSAFFLCTELTQVVIPSSVTSIGTFAFYNCFNLTDIVFPDSVTSIGSEVFFGTSWYDLQSDGPIYIGNILYKYKGEMPENTSISIKEGTKVIAAFAFYECSNLTDISIPSSVVEIGNCAFYSCSSLTEVNIPESVTAMGFDIFEKCGEKPDNFFHLYAKTGSVAESFANEYYNIKFISTGETSNPDPDTSVNPKKPDFTGDGIFDLNDVVYAKKAFLSFSGFSITLSQWIPVDKKEFSLQDVIWLKKAFLNFPGFEFSD